MLILRSGIAILLLSIYSRADTYIRQPSIDVIHYDISIELTDTSDSIRGLTKMHIRMRDEDVSGMWLDFNDMNVDKVRVGGSERPFTHCDGRLGFDFDRSYRKGEIAVVDVQYHGKPQMGGMLIGENSYGRRVFFADNWPDRARNWFPSIDHPSDKATVDFIVTAPEKYDVVSNGRLVKTQSLLDGRKLTHWSERKAIPTYCMVLGVAEFLIAHPLDIDGVSLDWYSYPQDSEAAAKKFGRSDIALRYFSGLVGPYPYEKLAQVQSIIGVGGMENSSVIFYEESSFQNTPVSEDPVPHEIAHQWFGNAITQSDWDHLWLSEGFATYFEALYYEHLQGAESLRRSMTRNAKKIQEYEYAESAPIVDPDLTDIAKKLNPLNYEKGAWVLHMLRGMLGDVIFFEGIRRYYGLHEGGNVLTEDFQKMMESVSGRNLNAFFHQWLYQPGWPDYHVLWHWDAQAREVEITFHQTQTTALFDMPLEVAIGVGSGRQIYTFRVAEKTRTFRIPMQTRPWSFEVDSNNWVLKSLSVIPY